MRKLNSYLTLTIANKPPLPFYPSIYLIHLTLPFYPSIYHTHLTLPLYPSIYYSTYPPLIYIHIPNSTSPPLLSIHIPYSTYPPHFYQSIYLIQPTLPLLSIHIYLIQPTLPLLSIHIPYSTYPPLIYIHISYSSYPPLLSIHIPYSPTLPPSIHPYILFFLSIHISTYVYDLIWFDINLIHLYHTYMIKILPSISLLSLFS